MFIQSIQRCINVIPGLSPYWHMHRAQLTAMIRQLGSPHLFFTLSAADLHWPELHRIIEQQRAERNGGDSLDINTLDPATAYDRCITNLTEFPHIVASFLQVRVKLFLNAIGKCHNMKQVDFWYRFEWQHRGSGHVHRFIWLENGPNIDDKDLSNSDHKSELVEYFKPLVFAESPIPGLPPAVIHPCQVSRPPEDKNNQTDVTEIINRCQRHTKCLESYCLRWNQTLKRKDCHFGYPQPTTEEATITLNHKRQWTFFPKWPAGDNNLNKYHPVWSSMWRGNINISPVFGVDAVINYIRKYVSKAESISKELDKIMLAMATESEETEGIGSIIARTLNKFCIERDFSAQEACHQLLSMPMVECS